MISPLDPPLVFDNDACPIAYSVTGSGPPVLLLHGFPQTRAMWAEIAPTLAERYTVITPDLRGYGASHKPRGVDAMSFRAMGADMAALMRYLGHARFHLVGHDRGARVAHRMALDWPAQVASVTVMDIVPTHHLLSALTLEVANAYYHWFFLAQPAPFPETMIGHDPDAYYERCLLGFGKAALSDFAPGQLAAYRAAWHDPAFIAASCDDYRAAIAVDIGHDALDLGRRVDCPALVLYGADGAMARLMDVPATWAPRLADMRAAAIPGGHFFPDQNPEATAEALLGFLGG
jgi:haloacetate dehalogenase